MVNRGSGSIHRSVVWMLLRHCLIDEGLTQGLYEPHEYQLSGQFKLETHFHIIIDVECAVVLLNGVDF